MRFFLLFAYVTAFVWLFNAKAQQNINSLTTKDIKVNGNLEVNSTSLASKPCPVMTEAQRNAIASPQSGRCVYNSNTNQLNIFNGTIWKSAGGGISNWETAFNYAINDVVIESNKIYQCNTAHTSSVFASDISKWTQIANNVSDVSGVLPMANGGTDKALTPTLGGVVYTDANSMEVLAAGASGQVLKSNGAAAPTWQDASNKLQGQDQTEVNFTKLKVPRRSATPTASGEYLLEPNDNLLYNGGFEATPDLDGWTCVGAGSSFTIESKPVSASVVISGDRTLAIGCATVGGCTCTQDFPVNQQQAGRSVLLSGIVRASSTVQGLKLTYRENGADTSVTTENVLNGIPATEAVIGSSATTIGIKLTIPYSATPTTVRVDEIKMSYGTAVTNQPAIGPRIKYSPTFQGFGTPSNVDCEYNQDGPNLILDCLLTSQSDSAAPRIGLPSGLTIGGTWTGNKIAGTFAVGPVGANKGGFALMAVGNSYITLTTRDVIGSASIGALSTSTVGSETCVAGVVCSIKAIVPIAQYASSVPTYTGRCNDPRACETVFSAKVSSGGVVSDENLDWINGNCGSGNPKSCSFISGIFTNPPSCSVSNIQATDAVIGAGLVGNPSTSSFTYYSAAAGVGAYNTSFNVVCQRQGQDYLNAKTLQQNVALTNYPYMPSSTRTRQVTFEFGGASAGSVCSSNPCTVKKLRGATGVTVSWATTGDYTVNFPVGTWANADYTCVSMGNQNGHCNFNEPTTPRTATTMRVFGNTTTIVNVMCNILCIGDY